MKEFTEYTAGRVAATLEALEARIQLLIESDRDRGEKTDAKFAEHEKEMRSIQEAMATLRSAVDRNGIVSTTERRVMSIAVKVVVWILAALGALVGGVAGLKALVQYWLGLGGQPPGK